MKRVLFFLGQLSDKDVEWMTQNGHRIEVPVGTKLIKKGEIIDNLYIVLSGQLIVYGTSESEPLATLGSGEIVGEMSFLESRPPSVSVISTAATSLYVISREQINARMNVDPEFKGSFYYALALFLSNRLRKTTDQLGYGNPEEEDLIDHNILETVSKAGSRFGQILTKFT